MSAFAETTRIAKHAVHGKRGVVAAQNRKAAEVGAAVLAVITLALLRHRKSDPVGTAA